MDTFVPDAIREFRSRNPGIEIQLLELGTLAQLRALENGAIQLGVVRLFQQDTRGLVVERIVQEPYVLALPSKHSLASFKVVPLGRLDGEPLILFPRRNHPALYDKVIACCSAAGCTPRDFARGDTTKVHRHRLGRRRNGPSPRPRICEKAAQAGRSLPNDRRLSSHGRAIIGLERNGFALTKEAYRDHTRNA